MFAVKLDRASAIPQPTVGLIVVNLHFIRDRTLHLYGVGSTWFFAFDFSHGATPEIFFAGSARGRSEALQIFLGAFQVMQLKCFVHAVTQFNRRPSGDKWRVAIPTPGKAGPSSFPE